MCISPESLETIAVACDIKSITCPSLMQTSVAFLGSGVFWQSLLKISLQEDPDIRIIPIPALPREVAIAAMVSGKGLDKVRKNHTPIFLFIVYC